MKTITITSNDLFDINIEEDARNVRYHYIVKDEAIKRLSNDIDKAIIDVIMKERGYTVEKSCDNVSKDGGFKCSVCGRAIDKEDFERIETKYIGLFEHCPTCGSKIAQEQASA